MSEFQTPDALDRLLADADREPTAAPLIAAGPPQPFSVILLDEFEKAHRADLGPVPAGVRRRPPDRPQRPHDRLPPRIVIMTSNLGRAVQAGPALGFAGRRRAFRDRDVDARRRARVPTRVPQPPSTAIVVFRRSSARSMRALLEKELDDVF